jgi:hypothetical protein
MNNKSSDFRIINQENCMNMITDESKNPNNTKIIFKPCDSTTPKFSIKYSIGNDRYLLSTDNKCVNMDSYILTDCDRKDKQQHVTFKQNHKKVKRLLRL